MPYLEPAIYDFLTPPRIVFGWGRRREIGALARGLGNRVFVILGSRTLEGSHLHEEILASLETAGLEVVLSRRISREPEVEDVDRAVNALREQGAGPGDVVVAVGGGSALDLAKAAAALAPDTQSPTVKDYLEGVGKGHKITRPPLPTLAVPTTAGTGSEATKNSVVSSYTPPFKKSLRSDLMLPRIALIDPELTVSVPAETTAWTGMDAMTQLIESTISRRARPLPRALALHGLELAGGAILEAVADGTSRRARESMAHAALLSGLALANSGLGLAHGVAAALGVHCRVPHGLACAVLLPVALRVNRPVREAEIAKVGEALTGRTWPTAAAAADAALAKVNELCQRLGVPRRLGEIGVRVDQIWAIARDSRGNSMSANPRELSDEELERLLKELL